MLKEADCLQLLFSFFYGGARPDITLPLYKSIGAQALRGREREGRRSGGPSSSERCEKTSERMFFC